ncbi:MotA/TolQ/ExbB proton channel family protein [Singulisphaera sp. Ch08]|uniref:MotA/TolQ/ExbB proton channel family protein n=1 Tax=Singulisphaera sp. Ch08 TaxID=3120278 RepID=A0AAU7CMP1_9BACT
MQRPSTRGRETARAGLALALLALAFSGGADGGLGAGGDLEFLAQPARQAWSQAVAWYHKTPPTDRVTWGGLVACAGLGVLVLLGRLVRLRTKRIIPRDFHARFIVRLQDGKLDRGKALDFCELNPSPAARVALGVVRRWDRPVTDQERALTMTVRIEAERLRRNVGTLRRIAALAPLLGLLGTLMATTRALATARTDWAPVLGSALVPFTAGVALAILALVAYDGLVGRVDAIVGNLERVGTETVDAIAMNTPLEPRAGRTPHSVRVDIPETHLRPVDRENDYA